LLKYYKAIFYQTFGVTLLKYFVMINGLNTLLFMGIGGPELTGIIILAVILFGGKKIPELMRGLGKGIREFKDAKDNVKSELENGMNEIDKDKEIQELRRQVEQQKQA
jgi:sec-independent protein translocase protein TatA